MPIDSQLLVFSKTGVQRAYTSPHNPRALYFDPSVAVAYVPGAPLLEVAAHDPQQGVVFYTLDQTAASPLFIRQQSCLTCHVAASTLDVPGMIARSHTVGEDGNILPQAETHAVNHQTRHPDRWGGWFVTSEDAAPPYQQLAHLGNITFSGKGNTSNQVFVDWMTSEPESRGYLLSSSDIAGLLVFDHQMHAINLLTRLNWESRVAVSSGHAIEQDAALRRLANELADYLLFAGEAPPLSELTPRPGFAASLAARTPAGSSRPFARTAGSDRPPAALSMQLHGVLGRVRGAAGGDQAHRLSADDRELVGGGRARDAAGSRWRCAASGSRDLERDEARLSSAVIQNSGRL